MGLIEDLISKVMLFLITSVVDLVLQHLGFELILPGYFVEPNFDCPEQSTDEWTCRPNLAGSKLAVVLSCQHADL